MTALYVPPTEESDHKKQNMSLQLLGSAITTNTAAIAALPATFVSSIAGNNGAFTLNSTSGITNSTNDILLSQASASQFGAVKVDGTTITASGGVISTGNPAMSKITAALSGDVSLNNTANYFDGPSIAQGSTGTWFVIGTVTILDTSSSANFSFKLWDGTTIISSGFGDTNAAGAARIVTLSGYLASPAGNLRISVKDATSINGKIKFNSSGNSLDSTISAFRIA